MMLTETELASDERTAARGTLEEHSHEQGPRTGTSQSLTYSKIESAPAGSTLVTHLYPPCTIIHTSHAARS